MREERANDALSVEPEKITAIQARTGTQYSINLIGAGIPSASSLHPIEQRTQRWNQGFPHGMTEHSLPKIPCNPALESMQDPFQIIFIRAEPDLRK